MDAAERMMTMMDKPLKRIAYFPPHDVDEDGEGSIELFLAASLALEGVLCCMVGLLSAVVLFGWI